MRILPFDVRLNKFPYSPTLFVMRKLLVGALLISGLLCLPAAPADMRLRTGGHPNVLFILCDDIRWDALGYAGNPYVKTPNIDRLAREGVQFKNMFCTTSLCSPS